MRLTIACPEGHIGNANHLAMALGFSEADGLTYSNPTWQDADGNRYALASLEVSDAFLTAATSPLARPAWDAGNAVDLSLASQAQAIVTLWIGAGPIPTPSPDTLLAVAGDDGPAAARAMGLIPRPLSRQEPSRPESE